MQDLLSYLNDFLLFRNFLEVITGLDNTLLLLVISLPIGFVLSLIFAIGRVSKNKFISKPIASYIFIIRGTPLLVQLYLIYYGLANIEFLRNSFFWAIIKEPYWCAIIAFSLNTGAYTSEILRSAFQTIKKGYIEAAQSLGVTKKITFYRIQLPIAIKQSLPAYGNEIILMLKGTSLASVITIMDLMGEARKVNVLTFKPFEAFITAGIIYLFITFIIHNIIKYLEKKYGFQT